MGDLAGGSGAEPPSRHRSRRTVCSSSCPGPGVRQERPRRTFASSSPSLRVTATVIRDPAAKSATLSPRHSRGELRRPVETRWVWESTIQHDPTRRASPTGRRGASAAAPATRSGRPRRPSAASAVCRCLLALPVRVAVDGDERGPGTRQENPAWVAGRSADLERRPIEVGRRRRTVMAVTAMSWQRGWRPRPGRRHADLIGPAPHVRGESRWRQA